MCLPLLVLGCSASTGDIERAIEPYNKAIRLDPQDASAYYNRGTAYYLLDQPKRAFQDFDQAIRLNPDNAKAYTDRGLS